MDILKKTISSIGLDIGSSKIKAVKITKKGKSYVFDNFAIEPVEEGTIQSGEIKNPSSLAQSARRAVKRCAGNATDVVLAIPNYSVLSDVLTMDLKPKKQLGGAVMVEATRISPFDINDVVIDYSVLEENSEEKKMKVLLTVAKSDIVLTYIDFLNEAGLQPVIVDVDQFALANIFSVNYDLKKYQSCILLNIGSETSFATFINNGIYHSTREISASGWNFRRELQLIPNLNAELITEVLDGKVDNSLDSDMIKNAINHAGKEFANSVGVAVSYFQASDNIEKVDAIFLSGGYAGIPGLINILELRTGAEVNILNPFKKIKANESILSGVEHNKLGPVLAVAMGLATRTE